MLQLNYPKTIDLTKVMYYKTIDLTINLFQNYMFNAKYHKTTYLTIRLSQNYISWGLNS